MYNFGHAESSTVKRICAILSCCSPDDNAIRQFQSHGQTADKLVGVVDATDSSQFLLDIMVHIVSGLD